MGEARRWLERGDVYIEHANKGEYTSWSPALFLGEARQHICNLLAECERQKALIDYLTTDDAPCPCGREGSLDHDDLCWPRNVQLESDVRALVDALEHCGYNPEDCIDCGGPPHNKYCRFWKLRHVLSYWEGDDE